MIKNTLRRAKKLTSLSSSVEGDCDEHKLPHLPNTSAQLGVP